MPVAAGSIAIDPAQFGGKGAVRPFLNQISGVVGEERIPFSGVTDVIGGPSPIPAMNVRDALKAIFGKDGPVLLIELVTGPDLGVTTVELTVPAVLPCPEGTKEQ
ncbi:hypothetical protein MYX65_05750 [Acidobacteria bacterium AH-259-L09]|nr:hypothetical protein [Acidobacteria bacterium AH-259-L09]